MPLAFTPPGSDKQKKMKQVLGGRRVLEFLTWLNFVLSLKIVLSKVSLSNSFSDFYYKKWFHWMFYTCKWIFRSGYYVHLCTYVPVEGGWDTGVGKSSSTEPDSRILIQNPVISKLLANKWQKVSLINSLQWKNTKKYLLANTFGKVKIWTILPTTKKFMVLLIKLMPMLVER